jgi:hypothetical protein
MIDELCLLNGCLLIVSIRCLHACILSDYLTDNNTLLASTHSVVQPCRAFCFCIQVFAIAFSERTLYVPTTAIRCQI